MSTVIMIVAIIILVALSAFFSASEMVFSSANKMHLENAVQVGTPGAKPALRIMNYFDDALSTILVGNNLVNIATSSIGSVIAVSLWGEEWTWVMTTILTIAVIILGETIPKIMAKKCANHWVRVFCYPIRFLNIVLKPVTVIVVSLVNLIMKISPKPHISRSEEEAQQELQSLIETAEDENVLDEEQSELLQAALEFDEVCVSEVMTARVDMEAIDIEDELDEVLNFAENVTYSRLPVYEESIDHIIGVLSLNRLYRSLVTSSKATILELMSKPVYLYKTTKLSDAMKLLRNAKQHLGIVVDEYGGTMGIVTVEDIMEHLVGDIRDEKDVAEEEEVIELSEGVYELDGDMQVSDFVELMGWKESEIDAESATLGGLTTEIYEAFPKEGDIVILKNAEIKVLEVDGLRVCRVLVTKITSLDEDEIGGI